MNGNTQESTPATEAAEFKNPMFFPEGFKLGDDIFNPDSWSGGGEADGQTADEQEVTVDGGDSGTDETETDGETPATSDTPEDPQETVEIPQDGTEAVKAKPPDGEEAEAAKEPKIAYVKYNHKDIPVNLDELGVLELTPALTALVQKSLALDASREAEAQARYRNAYKEAIDDNYPEYIARAAAREAAGGKVYPLEGETPAADTPDATTAANAGLADTGANFRAQLQQVRAIFPGVREMPQEVMTAYNANPEIPLVTIFGAWQMKADRKAAEAQKAEIAALKKENAVLKQEAKNTQRAVVKATTGGGTKPKADDDPFIQGFNSRDRLLKI